jgi:hypothetical protein
MKYGTKSKKGINEAAGKNINIQRKIIKEKLV